MALLGSAVREGVAGTGLPLLKILLDLFRTKATLLGGQNGPLAHSAICRTSLYAVSQNQPVTIYLRAFALAVPSAQNALFLQVRPRVAVTTGF